jgi:hypothetical protein
VPTEGRDRGGRCKSFSVRAFGGGPATVLVAVTFRWGGENHPTGRNRTGSEGASHRDEAIPLPDGQPPRQLPLQ